MLLIIFYLIFLLFFFSLGFLLIIAINIYLFNCFLLYSDFFYLIFYYKLKNQRKLKNFHFTLRAQKFLTHNSIYSNGHFMQQKLLFSFKNTSFISCSTLITNSLVFGNVTKQKLCNCHFFVAAFS